MFFNISLFLQGRIILVAMRGYFLGNHIYMASHYRIDPSHKSHNALENYPTMHNFVTEMCTHVHISVTNWCIVGYGTGALWDTELVHCGICATGVLMYVEAVPWNTVYPTKYAHMLCYGLVLVDFNSLAPGGCCSKIKLVIFKVISMIDIWSISCEIALRWMPQDLADD